MEFTLHKDFSELPSDAWNHLASAGISDTPFARYEYLSLWWKTQGGGEWADTELVLVSASEGGHLVGIAPMFAAEHEGRRAVLLIGSIEISDYLDLLVPAVDVDEFLEGLLDFLGASPDLAGVALDWYNIAETSPTLQALRMEAERRRWTYTQEVFRPTPRIALGGDFEAYLAGLDKKQRHEIRRKLRRATEAPTPSKFELLQSPALLETYIEEFLDLMAQDANKARFLTPAMRDHMGALTRAAWEGGFLWMAFLSVNGVKAAAAFNFDYKGKLWGYNSAVSRDFMDISPGWVLLARQIEWACEHGRSEFDFMRGDEAYKYRFGAVNRHVVRARLLPSK